MLPPTHRKGCFHIIGHIIGHLHSKNPLDTGTMWVTRLNSDSPYIPCLIIEHRGSGKGAIFIEKEEIIIRIPLPVYQGVNNYIAIRIGGIELSHQGSCWLVFCHGQYISRIKIGGCIIGEVLRIQRVGTSGDFRTVGESISIGVRMIVPGTGYPLLLVGQSIPIWVQCWVENLNSKILIKGKPL